MTLLRMPLQARDLDRAAGVLLAAAAGDALGVHYEPAQRGPADGKPQMLGGGYGRYAPGEWSDDTQMAVVIAEVAAGGDDLRSEAAQERIAEGFLGWFTGGATDVGMQTRELLGGAARRRRDGQPLVPLLRDLGAQQHAQTGRTAGNGSLMRTSPVALRHLGDPAAIATAARAVSALTHHDPVAGEACALWCLAIDHAVRTGEIDVRVGLPHLADPGYWSARLDEAEQQEPEAFAAKSGWVVAALQQAWSAIAHTPVPARPSQRLRLGLERAVCAGGDTDTVAAIAGALLGGAYGAGAVPAAWRRVLHGWPGLRARDLSRLAVLAAEAGGTDSHGWPTVASMLPRYAPSSTEVVPHPDDPGVLLGAAGALRPGVADAVVSLCRLGADDVPLAGVAPADHVEVWLVDREDANNDLPFVIADTAQVVRDLRQEGKSVLLHCVHAQARTPVVAAAYGHLVTGDPPREALSRVAEVLRSAQSRPYLEAGLDDLAAAVEMTDREEENPGRA